MRKHIVLILLMVAAFLPIVGTSPWFAPYAAWLWCVGLLLAAIAIVIAIGRERRRRRTIAANPSL